MIGDKKVLGIIAEYNPFHNGHLFHMHKAKELSGADYVVCVVSGNFAQRGNTSIVNKWKKAEMAMLNGVDLVVELPTVYSVSSAENFATGAVKILDSLGIVDAISFGTETDDFAALNNLASLLSEEPRAYKDLLSKELKKGLSFPKARENAIMYYLDNDYRYNNILNEPNNILGVEYLKALKRIKSNIQPVPIKREKVYYNSNNIVDEFASASGIRELLKNKNYVEVRKVVPDETYKTIMKELEVGNVVLDVSSFEKEILYTLRKMTTEEIAFLPDVSEGLENNLKNAACFTSNLKDFMDVVKTKRYTQSRIQRILICALLGITKKDMESSKKCNPYIRVLGFNQKGREIISSAAKNNSKLDIITSVKKYSDVCSNKALRRMLDIDIFATDVYAMECRSDFIANLDYTKNMIIMY